MIKATNCEEVIFCTRIRRPKNNEKNEKSTARARFFLVDETHLICVCPWQPTGILRNIKHEKIYFEVWKDSNSDENEGRKGADCYRSRVRMAENCIPSRIIFGENKDRKKGWEFKKKERVLFIDNCPWNSANSKSKKREGNLYARRSKKRIYYKHIWESLLKFCFKYLNKGLPPYLAICIIHTFRQTVYRRLGRNGTEMDGISRNVAYIIQNKMEGLKREGALNTWHEVIHSVFLSIFHVFNTLIFNR